MDLRAFYIQAAEAAATVAVRAADGDVPKLTPKAVLLQFEVQGVGLGGADGAPALPRHGKALSGGRGNGAGAAPVPVGVDGDKACEGGGAARDLTCPECGKVFLSDKAMYGHLRCHPERGYKGATRPATPSGAASVAGDARPRKVPRKEAGLSSMSPAAAAAVVGDRKPRSVALKENELSMRWPVTARRGRTPTTAANSVSAAAPAAVLESTCSEEEEAAMILLEMSSRGATPKPGELPMQQMHVRNAVDAGQQLPGVEWLELPDRVADDVAVHLAPEVEQSMIPDHAAGAVALQRTWEAEKPARMEHSFKIVMEPQAPEVEQALRPEHVAGVAAASEVKKPTKLEPVTEAVLVVLRDKKGPAGKPVCPVAKKPKKRRRLHDPDQMPPAEAAGVKPPARRIPSPASDRTYGCPACHKTFPTHQALGGHMASHNRVNKYGGAQQHVDGHAVAHAVHNIMAHHHRQDGGTKFVVPGAGELGEERQDIPPAPMAPQAPAQHPCSRCHLIFPTGQALGGHMRKHWLEDKLQVAAAAAAAPSGVAPRYFDLNELPRE